MKRILALVLCTLMTVALLAGCGSKKNDDTNNDKTWVVATDTTFRPFEYTDKDGNFVGIDVDIMAAVAADQGFKYELKSLGWDAAIAACKSKQANAMIAGASIKQDRIDSGWIFSDGYPVHDRAHRQRHQGLRRPQRQGCGCENRHHGRYLRREPEGPVRLHPELL